MDALAPVSGCAAAQLSTTGCSWQLVGSAPSGSIISMCWSDIRIHTKIQAA